MLYLKTLFHYIYVLQLWRKNPNSTQTDRETSMTIMTSFQLPATTPLLPPHNHRRSLFYHSNGSGTLLSVSPSAPISISARTHTTYQRSSLQAEPLASLQTDSQIVTKEAIGLLLQACGQQRDIETGRKVHAFVRNSTRYRNDYVLHTRLITMYALCGSPLDSRSVFDLFQGKNLFMWNALISGYVKNGLYLDAIEVFVEMLCDTALGPDNFTFPCVIKACGGVLDVGSGQVVHGMAIKMGLAVDVFVGNASLAMYGKFGQVEESMKVFDYMPGRNLVSWNSMICTFSENGLSHQSFNLLAEMLRGEEPLLPDVATVVTILPVCAGEGEIGMGVEVHGLAVKLGLTKELNVCNALVDMYLKCGCLTEAQLLFDKNDGKNVVSWNTMIGGFSIAGDVCGAFNLLRKMQLQGEDMKADDVTILNVLPLCSEKSQLMSLKEIHGYSLRHKYENDELVANAFVAAYAKCGKFKSAEFVFDDMDSRTVSSWNALMGGYAQSEHPEKALNLYIKMTHSSLEPDLFSIGSLLSACARLKSIHHGEEIHGFVLRNGLETDSFVGNSLLSLYIQCGRSSSARELFDEMKVKNLVSWNAMIAGYSRNGHPDEALILFRNMLAHGIQPHEIAIASVLGACSQLSALRLGKETHCYALKALLADDAFVGCSIIDMYAKSGCIKEAPVVFNGLRRQDVASWNALITAYGVHGYGKEAEELFDKMKTFGQMPDSFTFIGILIACSHAGLVEEGLKYFHQMQNSYGIKPKMEHYACLIDMLSRAGKLDEAFRMANEMPVEPDSRVWSSLLSSCRTFGALEMGERVAKKLLELEPDKAENYVLLSNLYGGSGKWDDVRRVRQMMKEIGLQKDVGCSWLELGGKVYSFTVGDNFLPGSEVEVMWRQLEARTSEI